MLYDFFPTLFGVILGTFLSNYFLKRNERKNYKKYINSLFIKYYTYHQSVWDMDQLLIQSLITTENHKETIKNNMPDYFNISETIPDLYLKYIKVEALLSLYQSDLYVKRVHHHIISKKYKDEIKLGEDIETLKLVSVKRLWAVHQVSKNEIIEYSKEAFDDFLIKYRKEKNLFPESCLSYIYKKIRHPFGKK